jgi:uncharacterized protein (TIGR03083 family)
MANLRGDRGFTTDEVLPAWRAAAAWNVAVVADIAEGQWDQPALGEWSVRELVAHASRAYTTIEQYLAPLGTIDIASAADYFRIALSAPDVNAAVAERGRAEATQMGDDPLAEVRRRREVALSLLTSAPLGAVAVTFVGTMGLADYLATRVVELTVHTLDLCDALGRDDEPPESAGLLSLQVIAAVAAGHSQAVLLRALTGRRDLPGGFSAFG